MGTETKNPAALLIRHLGISGMAENISDVLHNAEDISHDVVTMGQNWYMNGGRLAQEFTGLDSREQACGIVSALSPQTAWSENLKSAMQLAQTRTAPTFKPNVDKALAILDGAHPLDVLGGPKVRAFYMNLAQPWVNDHVTVDRHAVNVALGGNVAGSAKALDLSGIYSMVADAYKVVADKTFDYTPCQVQAIAWVAWRTINAPGHAANDPQIEA